MSKLICESRVKDFIKKKTATLRPGWDCKNVSQTAIDQIEAKVRAMIISCIRRHPTVGKTFKQVL